MKSSKPNSITTMARSWLKGLKCLKLLAFHRHSSSISHLLRELVTRRLPLIYDYLTPQPSYLLNLSLVDILPGSCTASALEKNSFRELPSIYNPPRMAVGHHLIYFPPQVSISQLLPDGTDIMHSPGGPFRRRVWAGGKVRFPPEGGPLLDGKRAVCLERIRGAEVTGQPGEEKAFVRIERRIATVDEGEDEESIRMRLWRDDEDDTGSAIIIERRNLVFFREKKIPKHSRTTADNARYESRAVKSPSNPEFSHRMILTKALLFRYSALMFNAHSIHLDRKCTQDIEGYRDLLVQGPLSLTLMLTVLRLHLAKSTRVITEVEYRNLAPLFVDEEMQICGKQGTREDGSWKVWIKLKDRGLVVRATIRTVEAGTQNFA